MTVLPRITYDRDGTPGIWAESPAQAYRGIGFAHGKHRPLQTLLLTAASRGELSARVFNGAPLRAVDDLVHRLDLVGIGERESKRLSAEAGEWIDAYVEGVSEGLRRSGGPLELRVLFAKIAPPNRASLVSAMLVSAYLGLAQGQERMEALLLESLEHGADPQFLRALFAPHLTGWPHPKLPKARVRPSPCGVSTVGVGGSNAWAVTPERSASGRAMVCGDPHLQIDQLPGLFVEIRARVGDDWWLGATIPGVPGLAVGRTRGLAWSGTFAVADNVDLTVERVEAGEARREEGVEPVAYREVVARRRFSRSQSLVFGSTNRGTWRSRHNEEFVVASRWAGTAGAAKSIEAYMRLPLAQDAAAAEKILEAAAAFSLHFVLGDRGGDVRYVQAGRVPRRTHNWSGLGAAYGAFDGPHWDGVWRGYEMPRENPRPGGFVVSANEARPALDGSPLSTLAQPSYRMDRIAEWLGGGEHHDVRSMQQLQCDVYSRQAARLVPLWLTHLPDGALKTALAGWDYEYSPESKGPHAFQVVYRRLQHALGNRLGGAWFQRALDTTEVGVWWAAAIDAWLGRESSYLGDEGEKLREALAVEGGQPRPWGKVQTLSMRNMVLGGLPSFFRLDRGPFPLPGSIATVCQGNLVPQGQGSIAVGPAYRMICDFAEDELLTALPGGIDGSPRSDTYDCWIESWRSGKYHRLAPPGDEEGAASI